MTLHDIVPNFRVCVILDFILESIRFRSKIKSLHIWQIVKNQISNLINDTGKIRHMPDCQTGQVNRKVY